MYLKALTLHGFKSFADATTLRFEPGVTAVVGPNGCGKSNIADSIRWVLGEQSAKALRGGKMQDVIFEGADTRKPAQLCEVSLLLTDCEKQLGSEFHEIEIMRRVHRDGQSEYFFNGQPCRLKDIQKLFMDTGVGRTSYSIMAQGQIDQILSSKPEERRAVFEEAAGITKYKSQRREALGKLALTDQNLARVSDIIGEVGRQIGSLRRQAAKAMRYKRLSHRLRHLSLASSAKTYAELVAARDGLEQRVTALRAEANERRTQLEQQSAALDAKKSDRSRLNQRVQDAQQAVYDVRSQREQAENGAQLADIKRTGLEDRLGSSRDNLTELEMQLREVSAQADTGAQDKQMQLGLLGSSDAVFQQRNRELAIVEGKLTKVEQELQQAKFQLLQFESTVARLRTDSSGYEVEQKTSLHRHGALAKEIVEVQEQETAAGQRAAEFDAKLTTVNEDKARKVEGAAAAQRAVGDATKEFRDGQRQLQDIDRQIAQRSARLKLLQQLQERWEGFGEGAKAVLQGRTDGALEGAARPVPLMQGLQVKAEFGRAIEGLLGSAVEAVSVSDLGTAQRVLANLERDQIGSVIVKVSGSGGSPLPGIERSGEPPLALLPAAGALDHADEGHPALSLLQDCYVADDLGAFLEAWRQHPEFSFLAVATRKGEVVDRRGLVTGGHFNARKQAQSLVQREIDLRETGKALLEEQKQHEAQKTRVDAITAALSQAEATLEQARQDVLSATQAAAAAQSEQRTAQRAQADVTARLNRMREELVGLERARDEAHVRWEKAQGALTEAEARAAAQRERIQGLETTITADRTDRDVKRESLAQARLELAERRQKVEVLDRGLGEMERRRHQLAELLVQRQHEIEAWSESVAELAAEAGTQRERGTQLAQTLSVAQQQVDSIRGELVALEKEITGLESAQNELRDRAETSHDDLSAQEIRLAENRQRCQFLTEDATREFQTEIGSVDWKLSLWRAEDEPEGMQVLDLEEEDEAGEAVPKRRGRKRERGEPTEQDLADLDHTAWEAVRAEVDALRQRLGSMGAVNLVAIEEYAELKQRHDFLKAQSDDLTKAKAELIAAIDEINQTSQQQFSVTFEQIKKNFAYTFQTLFGGGRAELELIQTEDILESGIEIVAQPPGTKLKGITLLSGGQKTLTAVALLFALYMVKPSPFCLLDELDAPLDESNIGRFTDLLKKFVDESQFIIITHNKRTVSAAAAIYGVTMEERGVSKTVSMRFNAERGEAEAHPRNIAESVRGAQAPLPVTV
ncbi:MAG TPA: chromosome segregation protein SMC [Opitutaceae bacterium]|jgi:chromosome segregation protein